MTAPPGVRPNLTPARPANKRTNTDGLDPVRVRHLVDAGQWLSDHWNLNMRRSRVRDLAVRYLRDGRSDIDFRTWFIAYSDPTGETAVRNVMRGAR